MRHQGVGAGGVEGGEGVGAGEEGRAGGGDGARPAPTRVVVTEVVCGVMDTVARAVVQPHLLWLLLF